MRWSLRFAHQLALNRSHLCHFIQYHQWTSCGSIPVCLNNAHRDTWNWGLPTSNHPHRRCWLAVLGLNQSMAVGFTSNIWPDEVLLNIRRQPRLKLLQLASSSKRMVYRHQAMLHHSSWGLIPAGIISELFVRMVWVAWIYHFRVGAHHTTSRDARSAPFRCWACCRR